MSTPHAIEIPAETMAALRAYAGLRQQAARQERIAVLCNETGPLSTADRRALQDALLHWRGQYEAAARQVREITRRLGG